MKTRRRLADLALSTLAGYVGTKAMEPVSMKLYQLQPPSAREREDAVRPGDPARIAAEKISRALGITLDEDQLRRAGTVLHHGLAIQWAPLYAVLRRRTRWSPVPAGLATGAAMSIVADELMTPAFGFSADNTAYPVLTHARGFVAHLVFGLAVAATVEAGWTVTGGRP